MWPPRKRWCRWRRTGLITTDQPTTQSITGYRAADHDIATGHSAQSSRLALTHPSLRTRRSRRLLWPKRQTARCLQGRSEAQRGKHARQQVFGREDEDEALTRWVGALVASQAGLLHEPAHRQSTRNLVPTCRGLCGRSSCSDGRILRTLASWLTAASWRPAFTPDLSAPLFELEGAPAPEPTLTTICLGLDGAWYTVLLLHLKSRDHERHAARAR